MRDRLIWVVPRGGLKQQRASGRERRTDHERPDDARADGNPDCASA
jgi:hypothetical protein